MPLLTTQSARGFGLGRIMTPPAAATDYESIATQTVGAGGVSSITFSSIPSTYKHLQIRLIAKWEYTNSTDFTNTVLNINGDFGNNYSYHRFSSDGSSSVPSSGGASVPAAYLQTFMPTNTGSEINVFGASVIDILDYANTNKNKTFRAIGGFDRNGSGMISFASAGWYNTAAISSIRIAADTSSGWMQHSTFALYGIKE